MDPFVRDLRSNPTDAERHLWYQLRLRQLSGSKFRRQRPIGPYNCDFVRLGASLVIELDGSQHVTQAAYDKERDTFLRKRGYRVLRFWNHDALARTESVIETIFEALQRTDMDGRFD